MKKACECEFELHFEIVKIIIYIYKEWKFEQEIMKQ